MDENSAYHSLKINSCLFFRKQCKQNSYHVTTMSHSLIKVHVFFIMLENFIPNTSKNMEVWKWRGWLILECHRWAKCLGAQKLQTAQRGNWCCIKNYTVSKVASSTLSNTRKRSQKSQQSVTLHFHHLTHSYNKSLKRNYGCGSPLWSNHHQQPCMKKRKQQQQQK